MVEFPSGIPTIILGSKVQAVSPVRKPNPTNAPQVNRGRTEFRTQTTRLTSSSRGPLVTPPAGSIVVPGGPGGASFTLTDEEIQKILLSGGVVEFPGDAPSVPRSELPLNIPKPVRTSSDVIKPIVVTSNPSASIVKLQEVPQAPVSGTIIKNLNEGQVHLETKFSDLVPTLKGGSLKGSDYSQQKVQQVSDLAFKEADAQLNQAPILKDSPVVQAIVSDGKDKQMHLKTEKLMLSQDLVKPSHLKGSDYSQQKVQQVSDLAFKEADAQLHQAPILKGSPAVQAIVSDSSDEQTQLKVEHLLEQKSIANDPIMSHSKLNPLSTQQRLTLDKLSSKYLQEKIPVGLSAYMPPPSYMSPFNYRVPHLKTLPPVVQALVSDSIDKQVQLKTEDSILDQGSLKTASLKGADYSQQKVQQVSDLAFKEADAQLHQAPILKDSPVVQAIVSDGKDKQMHLKTEKLMLSQDLVKPSHLKGSDYSQQKVQQVSDLAFKEADAQLHQAPILKGSPAVQAIVSKSNDEQTQLKMEHLLEQKSVANDPIISLSKLNPLSPQQRLTLDNLSSKYLQEKIPIGIPGYVPNPSFMSPFNYRAPHLKTLNVKSALPVVQEQQKMEQILM